MKDLYYKLLKKRLNKDNIIISDEDLIKIINIYNHILDFSFETTKCAFPYAYGFIFLPKKLYDTEVKDCYEIFMHLIRMNKNNLFTYLDYSFLLHNDCCGFSSNPLFDLNYYLRSINKYYGIYGDDFVQEYFDKNENIIENVIENDYEYLLSSKYIDDNYKNVIRLFKDAFNKNDILIEKYELYDYDYDYDIYLDRYLNALFYYFVINNLINTDYDNVCNYLYNIIDNALKFFDKINLVGINDNQELFTYIDYSYKNSKNKIKIIK